MNKYSIFLYDLPSHTPYETIGKEKNCLIKCFRVLGFARWNVRLTVHLYIYTISMLSSLISLSWLADSKKATPSWHQCPLCHKCLSTHDHDRTHHQQIFSPPYQILHWESIYNETFSFLSTDPFCVLQNSTIQDWLCKVYIFSFVLISFHRA